MSSMKLALLTLTGRGYNNNYGAVLQAYALQKVLSTMGYETELIDFVPIAYNLRHRIRSIWKLVRDRGLSYILKRLSNRVLKILMKEKSLESSQLSLKRFQKFEEFKQQFMIFTEKTYHSFEDLRELNSVYDIYVVGSDLVWSPWLMDEGRLKAYLLATNNGLKISYAASVGEEIPIWACRIFRKFLPEFTAISVRERTSLEAIKKCTGIEAKIVIDPTALLKKEELSEISRKPEVAPERGYVMVYDLHNSERIIPYVKKIAENFSLDVITYSQTNLGISFYDCGPREFLWFCENAEFVITSSFHGLVFSILFKKPFYAINPEPSAPASRIRDFLRMLGLESRFLNLDSNNRMLLKNIEDSYIDWKSVFKRLNLERKKSFEFLKNALIVS
ncbi:MAG: hypothetical protein DRO98_08040 [Archaeoglobales archaeon]|nr:MAG: hypothetical protein DRO98_08040 [Archaeoglobales archaeon]